LPGRLERQDTPEDWKASPVNCIRSFGASHLTQKTSFPRFCRSRCPHPGAEPLLRECLAISEKKQPDLWTTFNTKSMLGGALPGQNKHADAEPLLLQGYEELKQREAKIPPEGKVRQTEALERLVQLYDTWGKQNEAAKWRKELEERKRAAMK
jgi:hypothetical protein